MKRTGNFEGKSNPWMDTMRRVPRLLKTVAGIGVMSVVLCVGLMDAAHAAGLKIGEPFPNIVVSDLNGKIVNLPGDCNGKIAIIHFILSSCSYCIKEIAVIESVYNDYKGKELAPYSINIGESRETLQTNLGKMKPSYPILLDPMSEASKQCGSPTPPTTVICDAKGIVRYKIFGEVGKAGLKKILTLMIP